MIGLQQIGRQISADWTRAMERREEMEHKMTAPILTTFVAIVKFVFWLPLLTIDLAEKRIASHERDRCVVTAGIMWMLTIMLLLMSAMGRLPMPGILIFSAFLHYGLGAVFLLNVTGRFTEKPAVEDDTDYSSAS